MCVCVKPEEDVGYQPLLYSRFHTCSAVGSCVQTAEDLNSGPHTCTTSCLTEWAISPAQEILNRPITIEKKKNQCRELSFKMPRDKFRNIH